MAEYKKRAVKRSSKKKIKNAVTKDIEMNPSKPLKKPNAYKGNISKPKPQKSERPEKIRVIKGNKYKIKRRRLIVIALILLITISVILFSVLLPTGISDFFQNISAASGSGAGYPVTLGGGSITDVVIGEGTYIVASATNIDGFNDSGKSVFSYQHGYEMPIVRTAESRFILFSLGATDYNIYNYSKNLHSAHTDNPILSANICRNGYYAVATQSDSYTSQVTVFDDDFKQVYQWFCSDYIINDLVLSPDGKTLAVSVLNAQNGVYNSKIYILNYDSATPVKIFEYSNDLVVSLRGFNSNGFYAIFSNKTEYISWKKLNTARTDFEKEIIFARADKNTAVLVTCREANLNDNTVYVFDDDGENSISFNFSNEIDDISVRGKYIYILSGRTIYVYNLKIELLKSVECDFGIERIVPIGNFKIAVLNDNKIQKIVIE